VGGEADVVAPNEVQLESLPVDTVRSPGAPVVESGGRFGFGLLLDFLSKLADYLDQQLDVFNASIQPATTNLRFEITQSFKLEILRAVMTVTAPESEADDDVAQGAGQTIQLLDEQVLEVEA
jgi:hypothetical protein